MRRVALVLSLCTAVSFGQSGLRINEVFTGSPDYIEVANLGPDIVYMGGYTVYWGCHTGAAATFSSGSYTFPAGVVLYPGGLAVLTDSVGNTSPNVPVGVYRAYIGSNILWATMPNGTPSTDRNGVATLVAPGGVGIDRVQWGATTTSFGTVAFGAAWSGTFTMTGATGFRLNNADTDGPADWGSSPIPSSGVLTAPGQFPIVGLTHVITSSGGGQATLTITSSNPALPGVEVYNLVSLIDSVPNGSGPVFGVGADVIPLAIGPAAVGNPFHTFLDGAGVFTLSVDPGFLPPGLRLEGVAITVQGGLITRISTVSEIVL
jgi:hypothetical protein